MKSQKKIIFLKLLVRNLPGECIIPIGVIEYECKVMLVS